MLLGAIRKWSRSRRRRDGIMRWAGSPLTLWTLATPTLTMMQALAVAHHLQIPAETTHRDLTRSVTTCASNQSSVLDLGEQQKGDSNTIGNAYDDECLEAHDEASSLRQADSTPRNGVADGIQSW